MDAQLKEVSAEEAWKYIYPERVVLVVTWDRENSRPDVMPAGWGMRTSHLPPVFAVSIGRQRHTHKLLEKEGEFVLAVAAGGMETEVAFWGSNSGADVDKFKEMKTETRAAKNVKPPLIPKAAINLECRVTGRMDTGDHTIFAGKVLKAYINRKAEILLNFGGGRFR